MKRRTLLLCLVFALVGTLTMGCQGKKEKRGGIAKGRNARGDDSTVKASDRKWGGIYTHSSQTQTDDFWQAVYALTFAQLEGLSEDQQLGYVSGSASSSSSGVRFWGDVKSNGKGGMDTSASSIHIYVYDDKVGSTGTPITIHIGPDIEGYVRSGGTISATKANVMFEDAYGMVRFDGDIANGDFTGTVTYYTYQTGNSGPEGGAYILGSFKVKSAGFFRN
jgi:hypothetical protein